VTFAPPDRMDFAQLTDPFWQTISNIVGDGPDGPTLTLALELSPDGVAKAAADPGFARAMHEFVEVTLVAIVDALHQRQAS